HDSVYAFDADTGKQYWHVRVVGSGETASDDRNCSAAVTPEIGITSTPIIDLHSGPHGTLYVVAASEDASGNYYQRLHALDIVTGAEEFGGPTTIQAKYPGTGDNSSNGSVIFDPSQYLERAALLLLNGVVYTSWASHCDNRPYTGWLIGYSESTLKQASVLNFTPNGNDGAIWNAGAGPASDAQGYIYIALANGTFDTTLTATGFPSLDDYGNAIVKVSTANGKLSVTDYWTMDNTVSESAVDTDLGSGGAMLLPNQTDSSGKTRQLVVAAGKDTNLYVADSANMGQFNASFNSTIYQALAGALPGGMWSSPAYFNGQVYYGSFNQKLFAFPVTAARLSSSPLSTTTNSFNYPGTTPSVSSYGTTNGIVWATENLSTENLEVLHAYSAANLATELYNTNQAAGSRDHFDVGNKFITPIIANGKVYVGTTNSVAAFGLLSATPPPVADGDHVVTNLSSQLVLDDPGFSTTSGKPIDQWTGNGGANVEWFFSSQGGGYYVIQNVSSGLLLTDPNGTTAPGAVLVQQAPTFDNSQLWSLIAYNGGYLIQNKASGLVIDDPGFSLVQGTAMILWPRNNGKNQVWIIQ
ncbi:MAG: RICIN domain-containing protein, partial [Alloacidobacterium sp.]